MTAVRGEWSSQAVVLEGSDGLAKGGLIWPRPVVCLLWRIARCAASEMSIMVVKVNVMKAGDVRFGMGFASCKYVKKRSTVNLKGIKGVSIGIHFESNPT